MEQEKTPLWDFLSFQAVFLPGVPRSPWECFKCCPSAPGVGNFVGTGMRAGIDATSTPDPQENSITAPIREISHVFPELCK